MKLRGHVTTQPLELAARIACAILGEVAAYHQQARNRLGCMRRGAHRPISDGNYRGRAFCLDCLRDLFACPVCQSPHVSERRAHTCCTT